MRHTVLLAMVGGLGFAAWAAAQSGSVSFAPHVDIAVGASPYAVIAADFNGDGDADLATANYDTDDVSVLLGNGDGTFESTGPFDADIGPSALQTADFDENGSADLAVANDIAGTVSVLLGNGDGSFQGAQDFAVGSSPYCAGGECQRSCTTAADCPWTGASCGSDGVCRQPCNVSADCTCSAVASCIADSSPEGVAIGRFNADDHFDIATANLFDGDDGTVSILLGNGDGTFEPGQIIAVGGGPWGIAAGRIDADANVDLAVSASDAGVVAVLLGNGDGTFRLDDTHEAGLTPQGLVIRDLDGDGAADLAVVNADSDSVSVLLGNGDATFATAVDYLVGGFPEALAAGDFDGDQVPDIVSADSFGTDEFESGSVSVLVGNGDGTFASAQSFEVNVSPFGVTVGDFNGDQRDDIVTANADSDDVSLLLNEGSPCVGDCNNDGSVKINELIIGVNIALETDEISACRSFDRDGSGKVEINELITAVNSALDGCPA